MITIHARYKQIIIELEPESENKVLSLLEENNINYDKAETGILVEEPEGILYRIIYELSKTYDIELV